MRSIDVTIPVSADESVSGVLVVPQGFAAGLTAAVIVAHGAGNDMHTPLLVHFSAGLGRAGYLSLRFNFPMLFFAGTRDALCDLELLKHVVKRISASTELDVTEGGDHSFVLPKSAKTSEEEVCNRILNRTVAWLKQTI